LLAGRSPLGGPRETALATLIAVRLASGAVGSPALPAPVRQARAEAARHWMTSVTLPAQTRAALLKLVAASGADDSRTLASAFDKVTDVVAAHLDRPARSEMDRLAARLAARLASS
jgi:hypothetical protein